MKRDFEIVHYETETDDYRSAGSYDERRYVGSANEYKKRVTSNAYTKLIGPLGEKRILDLGCGTGRGVTDFADKAKLAIGADASHAMLTIAAQKLSGHRGVGFVETYAQQLPFPDACFDVVTSLNFLHLFSLPTQKDMVSEMKRVVKPGGVIVLEFDNALQGVILGLYKRWSGRERGSLPSEIRYVIGNNCAISQIHGAVFPVVWRVFHHFPNFFTQIEKLAYYRPLNRLTHRIFYKLVRDS